MLALHEMRVYASELHVNVNVRRSFAFRAHWHRETELIYILKGRTVIGINSEAVCLEKGDLAVCKSGDIHYYSGDGDAQMILLIFAPEILEPELQTGHLLASGIKHSELVALGIDKEVRASLKRIYKEFKHEKPYYKTALRSGINSLVCLLNRNLPCAGDHHQSANDTKQRMLLLALQQLLAYMEEHYSDQITLNQAAERMHFSPWYFSKMFKKLTGRGFVVYLNTVRIQKAQAMIQETGDSLIKIAMQCGFENLRTFNRVFKQQTGATPGSLRKGGRA